MDEEDTFKKLKKVSYNELGPLWAAHLGKVRCSDSKARSYSVEWEKFLSAHFWTHEEYSDYVIPSWTARTTP